MTVTSIRLQHGSLGPTRLGPSKPSFGLLPTPSICAWATNQAAPVPALDGLSARGVVCVDKSMVELSGDKTAMVPKLLRIKRELIRGRLKNSFLEFEPMAEASPISVRRKSCPNFFQGMDGGISGADVVTEPSPQSAADMVTTYMIRNIPTRFTSLSFVRLLEDYGFGGTFNFFYLPMDFRSGKNMGYAFINFLDPDVGLKFVERFHARRLPVTTSKKVMEISPSRRQGLLENISLFRTSDLLNSVSLPHYKPLIATPETGGVLVPLSEHNFPPVH